MMYAVLLVSAIVIVMFILCLFLIHFPKMTRDHRDFQGYCDTEIAKIEAEERKLAQRG